MTIQEQVNLHLKNAILTSDTKVKSILRVLIGEFNRINKIIGDDKAIPIIKKLIDNAKERNNKEINETKKFENLNEIVILETYLPKQLSETELGALISALIYNNNYTIKDLGKIMNALKEKYSGQYDGKLASVLTKELLSK